MLNTLALADSLPPLGIGATQVAMLRAALAAFQRDDDVMTILGSALYMETACPAGRLYQVPVSSAIRSTPELNAPVLHLLPAFAAVELITHGPPVPTPHGAVRCAQAYVRHTPGAPQGADNNPILGYLTLASPTFLASVPDYAPAAELVQAPPAQDGPEDGTPASGDRSPSPASPPARVLQPAARGPLRSLSPMRPNSALASGDVADDSARSHEGTAAPAEVVSTLAGTAENPHASSDIQQSGLVSATGTTRQRDGDGPGNSPPPARRRISPGSHDGNGPFAENGPPPGFSTPPMAASGTQQEIGDRDGQSLPHDPNRLAAIALAATRMAAAVAAIPEEDAVTLAAATAPDCDFQLSAELGEMPTQDSDQGGATPMEVTPPPPQREEHDTPRSRSPTGCTSTPTRGRSSASPDSPAMRRLIAGARAAAPKSAPASGRARGRARGGGGRAAGTR
jgi:hypothetical protein